MSISLTRRDALRGAVVAGAALAASPYLLNLTGGVETSPIDGAPEKANVAPATSVSAATAGSAASGSGTTVLVINGDMVNSYNGLQTVRVQDAALAAKLKSAILARFE